MAVLSPHTRTRLLWRNGKKVRAHRWIMEQHLGRKLTDQEQIHHINGDPLDNRIENLAIMTANSHLRLHKQIYSDIKQCVVCSKPFTVHHRKRKRNKCCSPECAMALRIQGRLRQCGKLN